MKHEDKTKKQLINELEELSQRVVKMEAAEWERKRTEEVLQKRTHDLGERVKELNCLYGISKILEKPEVSVNEALQCTVDLIPPSWQYPEITCARIILGDKEFKTENFRKTIWKQASFITVNGQRAGTLEVYYLEEKPQSDEGPFLKEERSLIDALAERLGRVMERKRTEEMLQQRTHDLGERVKELNCLYGVSKIIEKSALSIKEIFQGTVDLIPPSWQYPGITCARIILNDQEFKTENFRETIWKQVSYITVNGARVGALEVCYLEEKPEIDEGPFLKEERSLINALTERLGKVIVRKQTEEALRESEELYRILTERVADGVALIQGGKLLFVNDAFVSMFGSTDSDQQVGKEAVDLFSDNFKQSFKKMHETIEAGASDKRIFQGQCLTVDGREIWVEGRSNIIRWKGKPAVLMTTRDITENRLREMAVQDEAEHLRRENIKLRASIKDRFKFGKIIGKSHAMQEVYELILKATASDAGVIIYGESGTGKELISWTIHDMSKRHDRTFVPVNCGAIPEALFESEFFGYRKGAFTGANMDKHGFFDIADGGTLFLDEIGELTLNMQVKLLRAIEGSGYTPVGGSKIKKSDFRVITATNKNLSDRVNKGLMREDFFYRIHIIPITLPPLKNRKEDIPLLVDDFMRSYSDGKRPQAIPGKVMEALQNYDWPGNVRELQNVLHRYLSLNRLDFMGTPPNEPEFWNGDSVEKLDLENLSLHQATENFQKGIIAKVLDQAHWHRNKAASMLAIDRKTLFRKMKFFGLG
ncbi:MAG: sigma 54-interacting transcriptional regulator [Desulfatiglandales bacterium]